METIKHQQCQDGKRAVSKMPKEGELCIVPDQVDDKPDGQPISKYVSMDADSQEAQYNHVFNVPGELRACSDYEDALENSLMMTLFKIILVIVCLLLTCFCTCWCALSQLSRKYENLEKKRVAHLQWLERAKSDSERGLSGPRTSFSNKIAQMQR